MYYHTERLCVNVHMVVILNLAYPNEKPLKGTGTRD